MKASQILGVRRATLSALLNGNAALSPEMALRIEKAFNVSMDMLLRMQAWYDAAQDACAGKRGSCPAVRSGLTGNGEAIRPWCRRFGDDTTSCSRRSGLRCNHAAPSGKRKSEISG